MPLKPITIIDPNSAEDQPALSHEQEIIKIDEDMIAPIHDTGSAWYVFLSLLIPVLGLIGYFVFKSQYMDLKSFYKKHLNHLKKYLNYSIYFPLKFLLFYFFILFTKLKRIY